MMKSTKSTHVDVLWHIEVVNAYDMYLRSTVIHVHASQPILAAGLICPIA